MSGLVRLPANLSAVPTRPVAGVLIKALGTVVHARLPEAAVGEVCTLRDPRTGREIPAEVVGFEGKTAVLVPIGEIAGLSAFTEVIPRGKPMGFPVGDALLGRVLYADGSAADGLPLPADLAERPLDAAPPAPMSRAVIASPLATGVRAIDALATAGEGQRVGIYGEPGGGKSTLLAEIIRSAAADVAVVGLIGERGREVREFVERTLGDGLSRTTVVVATSERPAMERVKAAHAATALAEHHRDEGRRVLLVVDSITRYARALREIGLAAGEPPTRRGFPASTFAALPRLLERAGPGATGSITAFYTVLVEGDGTGDPVAEETRGILDGHLILSAKLAGANHYPAIDVLGSRSRVMGAVVSPEHAAAAGRVRTLLSRYGDAEFLVRMGEYKAGADAETDEAVAKNAAINAFLRQAPGERAPFEDTVARLRALAEPPL